MVRPALGQVPLKVVFTASPRRGGEEARRAPSSRAKPGVTCPGAPRIQTPSHTLVPLATPFTNTQREARNLPEPLGLLHRARPRARPRPHTHSASLALRVEPHKHSRAPEAPALSPLTHLTPNLPPWRGRAATRDKA